MDLYWSWKKAQKIHSGEEIKEITRAQECKARSHGSMESEELAENRRPGKLGRWEKKILCRTSAFGRLIMEKNCWASKIGQLSRIRDRISCCKMYVTTRQVLIPIKVTNKSYTPSCRIANLGKDEWWLVENYLLVMSKILATGARKADLEFEIELGTDHYKVTGCELHRSQNFHWEVLRLEWKKSSI